MALSSRIDIKIAATLTAALDLSTKQSATEYAKTLALANGVGLNQGDTIFTDRRTLATGANEDLDVAGGGLVDGLGVAFAPARLKLIWIAALTTNTTSLTVSRPASGVPFLAAAADAFVLTPGGFFILGNPSAAGIAVTAGTGDLINVLNSAGADGLYDIILIGGAT